MILLPTFDGSVSGEPGSCKMHLSISTDGHNFTLLGDGPTYTPTVALRDPDILFLYNQWWLFYTADTASCTDTTSNNAYFGIANSTDGLHWSAYATVTPTITGAVDFWAPKPFIDADGSIYVMLSAGNASMNTMEIYSLPVTSSAANPFSSFGAGTSTVNPQGTSTVGGNPNAITGTNYIDGSMYIIGGAYILVAKNNNSGTQQLVYFTCTGPTAGCSLTASNWGNWGAVEAGSLVTYTTSAGATAYRMYMDQSNAGTGMAWSESPSWPGNSGTWSAPVSIGLNANGWVPRSGVAVAYGPIPANNTGAALSSLSPFQQDTTGNIFPTSALNASVGYGFQVVNSCSNTAPAGTGSPNLACTFTNPLTPGSVILSGGSNSNNNTISVADTATNTYADAGAGAVTAINGSATVAEIFCASNTFSTASNTVTLTAATSTNYPRMFAVEIVGAKSCTSIEAATKSANNSSTSGTGTGNVYTPIAPNAINNDLIFGFTLVYNGVNSAGSGFTAIQRFLSNQVLTEYKVQGIAGSTNAVSNDNTSADPFAAFMVALKPASNITLPSAPFLLTSSNCSSSASPAACANAPSGSVVVTASATTVTVNTSVVTANSQILVTFDASLGAKLGVTCNATEPALFGVSARTAGVSFTITSSAPVTNPACFSYTVIN
jgi:hypothetical protein